MRNKAEESLGHKQVKPRVELVGAETSVETENLKHACRMGAQLEPSLAYEGRIG